MRVLWILAHPEPGSLNGTLRDEGLRALAEAGHDSVQSDLYAMRWNPVIGPGDFRRGPDERLDVSAAAEHAYATGSLSDDIQTEHEKIAWADTIVVQFPLWWYGMPAVLKGWFDRVFVKGFAFGVTEPGPGGRTRRYGDGLLAGKRAMVVVTAGARAESLGPRGINGEINDLLFPLQHGTLWYAGISVVAPLVIPAADRVSAAEYATAASRLRARLAALPTSEPLPFRHQNRGDYDDTMVLRDDLAPGRTGLAVHYAAPA